MGHLTLESVLLATVGCLYVKHLSYLSVRERNRASDTGSGARTRPPWRQLHIESRLHAQPRIPRGGLDQVHILSPDTSMDEAHTQSNLEAQTRCRGSVRPI